MEVIAAPTIALPQGQAHADQLGIERLALEGGEDASFCELDCSSTDTSSDSDASGDDSDTVPPPSNTTNTPHPHRTLAPGRVV